MTRRFIRKRGKCGAGGMCGKCRLYRGHPNCTAALERLSRGRLWPKPYEIKTSRVMEETKGRPDYPKFLPVSGWVDGAQNDNI